MKLKTKVWIMFGNLTVIALITSLANDQPFMEDPFTIVLYSVLVGAFLWDYF